MGRNVARMATIGNGFSRKNELISFFILSASCWIFTFALITPKHFGCAWNALDASQWHSLQNYRQTHTRSIKKRSSSVESKMCGWLACDQKRIQLSFDKSVLWCLWLNVATSPIWVKFDPIEKLASMRLLSLQYSKIILCCSALLSISNRKFHLSTLHADTTFVSLRAYARIC